MHTTLRAIAIATVTLPLFACQNSAPPAPSPKQHAVAQQAAQPKSPRETSHDTVAVTKQEPPHTASKLQQAMPHPAADVGRALQALQRNATPEAEAIHGDARRGKAIAKKCAMCHNFNEKKKVGPGLKGIVGRKAGTMADMRYSAALAKGGWVWTPDKIAIWDCDSGKAIKRFSGNPAAKTKMPAQHICDPAKQADLIAFLKTL